MNATQYGQLLKARKKVGYLPIHHSKLCKSKQALRHLRQSGVLDSLEKVPSEFVTTRAMNADGMDRQFVLTEFEVDAGSEEYLAKLSYLVCLLSEHLATEIQRTSAAALSRRQTECLRWISQGKTSDEISELVGISKHTINNYIANATKKLGSANRTEAICLAIKQGLI